MILRVLEYLGWTTKGSRLTHAEVDQNFIDLYALIQAALKGLQQYNPATTYPAGSCAVYGGKIYQANVTATGAWDALKWQEVPTPNSTFGFPAWENTSTYGLNDFVEYNLKLYRSLQAANTGHSPATSPTWWVEVSASTSPVVPVYAPGLYQRGQLVWIGSSLWYCAALTLNSTLATLEAEISAYQWLPVDLPVDRGIITESYTVRHVDQVLLVDTTAGSVPLSLSPYMPYLRLEIVRVAGTNDIVLQLPEGHTLNGMAGPITVNVPGLTSIVVFQPFNSNFIMSIDSQEGGLLPEVVVTASNAVSATTEGTATPLSLPDADFTAAGVVLDTSTPGTVKGTKDGKRIHRLVLKVSASGGGNPCYINGLLGNIPTDVNELVIRAEGGGADTLVVCDADNPNIAAPPVPPTGRAFRLFSDLNAALSPVEEDEIVFELSGGLWKQIGGGSY